MPPSSLQGPAGLKIETCGAGTHSLLYGFSREVVERVGQ